MFGQINRGTKTGDFIYSLCLQKDISLIVEIGTWNGRGSTKCIADAIIDKNDNSSLTSIEFNKQMYQEAYNTWGAFDKKIKILHGRIVEKNDIMSIDKIKNFSNYNPDWLNWYYDDLENLDSCNNVINQIPDKIDLLLLDGGEFTTLAEFNKLNGRFKYLLCDDTKSLKCLEISKIMTEDNSFELIFNCQSSDRNGFMAWRKL